MTDKEMARDYALTRKKNLHFSQRDTNLIQLAYLHGLKAGRPQWHNVADGDLPEEGTEVLNDDGVKVVRINGHWRYVYGEEWEDDAYLDHWCEIPTFDKE